MAKLAAAAVIGLLAACSSDPAGRQPPGATHGGIGNLHRPPPDHYRPSRPAPGYDTVGIASWYGSRYHGRQTANGEIFDMNAPTAAHRSLPFGSRVHVTNLENGRSVIVRINDRGPFVPRRIIDVSRRAAQELGFIHQGVTRVRVRLIGRSG